jgi:hypothetical protein
MTSKQKTCATCDGSGLDPVGMPGEPCMVCSVEPKRIPRCEGCGTHLNPVEALQWGVCMDCTRARHATAVNGNRCRCGQKAINGGIARIGSRSWIPCSRCLGVMKQLS